MCTVDVLIGKVDALVRACPRGGPSGTGLTTYLHCDAAARNKTVSAAATPPASGSVNTHEATTRGACRTLAASARGAREGAHEDDECRFDCYM